MSMNRLWFKYYNMSVWQILNQNLIMEIREIKWSKLLKTFSKRLMDFVIEYLCKKKVLQHSYLYVHAVIMFAIIYQLRT